MIRILSLSCQYLLYATLIATFISCGKKKEHQDQKTLFFPVPPSVSNVEFENTLTDSDDFNIIEYLYFYNGGGVSAGDVNNDGLTDLYFSSNQQGNKLYLNKGNFKFEDITEKAGVSATGNWKTGVTMADVNGDGWLDIFVCGVGSYKKFAGKNQLFINNRDQTFTDKTEEYNLSFQGFSTQASFFDYDNDGDLDMFLLNHSVHSVRSYGDVTLRLQSDRLAGDKLYRNDLVPSGVTHFEEVTSAAGIFSSQIGYGLGVGVSDLNSDGYLDIYVSNDFHENDYLYINNGDGTFKQELEKSIPHSSRFSMGCDIADINNDGWSDIVSLDMLPADEPIIKTTAGEDPYDIFQFKLGFGYHYQFARNTLQLNRGFENGNSLIFSDIAPLAGIEATDWSWAPLLADFDNDGYKDLFIANGILRRPNDLDYINFISKDSVQRFFEDAQFIEKMPSGEVPNFFFRNKHDLTFEDVSSQWIATESNLSNGAAYADLDNDGDLDLIVNNINSKASIYRNDVQHASANFLKIQLNGTGANTFGIGTKIIAFSGDKKIYHEQIPTRGWQSSVDYMVHIGLGKIDRLDSLTIVWPDGKYQVLRSVAINHTINVDQNEAVAGYAYKTSAEIKPLVSPGDNGVLFTHKENDFNAFNTERLIPHMASTQGPIISVGDINGDKLSDFFVGGASGQPGAIFVQGRSGNFIKSTQKAIDADSLAEDVGSVLFDADGNGTLDLVVVSGGQQYNGTNKNLLPRLYLNNGKGSFRKATEKLPEIFLNASCVRSADIDNDADQDLFIGGRVISGQYGLDPLSYILINDGKGKFTDKTDEWLPKTKGMVGMVSDAAWTDLNGDHRQDLIVVGEWMPVTILLQDSVGHLIDRTAEFGLSATTGWWNSILMDDFDNDGDQDFVAGNYGLNSRLRASTDQPVEIYIGDIDGNGSLDQLLTRYNGGKKYPFVSRDQLVKQVPSLKKKFLKYKSFENVTISDILSEDQLNNFVKKKAEFFASAYFENTGSGKFEIHSLPTLAQIAPIFSFASVDLNSDGFNDLISGGNLFSIQPDIGRSDAGYGLVMLNEKGKFKAVPLNESGFRVRDEIRSINTVETRNNGKVILIGRNNSDLLIYKTGVNKRQPAQ